MASAWLSFSCCVSCYGRGEAGTGAGGLPGAGAGATRKLKDEKARTEEINGQKEYMQTDEYVEEAARDRLGLVKDNEIIFKEAGGE